MSWLKKTVSKTSAQGVEQLAEEVLNATPTASLPTKAVDEAASEPAAEAQDESPIKQRRYFVKQGLFVDHEDEIAAGRDEIIDKRPVDLNTLFSKE